MNVSDYTPLVTSNHRVRPKFRALLSVLIQMWADYAACLEQVTASYDKGNATGAQLDMIGKLVGARRALPFTPQSGGRNLSDDDYRKLITAAIAQNAWDGANETLPGIISAAFPQMGIVIRDNMDMSVSATVRGAFTDLQLEMLNADLLIPRPAGVNMTYEVPLAINETTVKVQGGIFATQTTDKG